MANFKNLEKEVAKEELRNKLNKIDKCWINSNPAASNTTLSKDLKVKVEVIEAYRKASSDKTTIFEKESVETKPKPKFSRLGTAITMTEAQSEQEGYKPQPINSAIHRIFTKEPNL